MPISERRAAFLDGEGTLTLREVREWAQELTLAPSPPSFGWPDDTPLMVALVRNSQCPIGEGTTTEGDC